jgi:hypothetical protein
MAMLLVVVVDLLNAQHTRILGRSVSLASRSLVPVKDAANKGRDEECLGFSSCDSLDDGEEEGQVAINSLGLQLGSGVNSLVSRRNLNQDLALVDANRFVEL